MKEIDSEQLRAATNALKEIARIENISATDAIARVAIAYAAVHLDVIKGVNEYLEANSGGGPDGTNP